MVDQAPSADLLGLTAEIVAAHVSNNPVALADLPNLIQDVYLRRSEKRDGVGLELVGADGEPGAGWPRTRCEGSARPWTRSTPA